MFWNITCLNMCIYKYICSSMYGERVSKWWNIWDKILQCTWVNYIWSSLYYCIIFILATFIRVWTYFQIKILKIKKIIMSYAWWEHKNEAQKNWHEFRKLMSGDMNLENWDVNKPFAALSESCWYVLAPAKY